MPAAVKECVVDEGLRAYMLRIYNYLVPGLAITGLAATGFTTQSGAPTMHRVI